VREDGYTFDIVGGPHDGETGHRWRDCPDGEDESEGCRDSVDPAMVCRLVKPAESGTAKCVCSLEHAHVGWECGLRDGVCTVL
jgi:hypothetical protein